MPSSRRNFLKNMARSGGLVTLPELLFSQQVNPPKKKIVVVGGHPDDPESGCGGTVAHLTAAGHAVTLMYFTGGDEGIEGKSHEEAAAIRRKEAIEACKILKARALFVDQIDGESIITNPEMARFQNLLRAEKPDIVFAHWPIDSHKDHQLSSVLTVQSWIESRQPFSLYFYEVCTGNQSFVFHPTDYVDITQTHATKLKALACHASQKLVDADGKYSREMYDCGHPAMEGFRGKELGVPLAEAFIRMRGRGAGHLTF